MNAWWQFHSLGPKECGNFCNWMGFITMELLLEVTSLWGGDYGRASCTGHCESHLLAPELLPGQPKGLPPGYPVRMLSGFLQGLKQRTTWCHPVWQLCFLFNRLLSKLELNVAQHHLLSLSLWLDPECLPSGHCFIVSEVKVAQSCPTLCDPMDYTLHGILQATILEWVALPFSRGSFQPRDRTQISHIAGGFFTSWAISEAQREATSLLH